jgi:hypothetical protein
VAEHRPGGDDRPSHPAVAGLVLMVGVVVLIVVLALASR